MREIYRSLLFLELRKKTHVLHKLILIVVFEAAVGEPLASSMEAGVQVWYIYVVIHYHSFANGLSSEITFLCMVFVLSYSVDALLTLSYCVTNLSVFFKEINVSYAI